MLFQKIYQYLFLYCYLDFRCFHKLSEFVLPQNVKEFHRNMVEQTSLYKQKLCFRYREV